jgi:hypothetical protein
MDLYADANFSNSNPTGFTNNWLESRNNSNLFMGNYTDYNITSGTSLNTTGYKDIISKRIERSDTSDMFFDQKNVKHLKWLICNRVYQQSGGKYKLTVESQSDEVILTVMMSIFMDHAHYTGPVDKQVAELNYMVMVDMVPRVIQNINLMLSYQRDAQQPLPMTRPMNMSSAGTRSNFNTKSFV